MINREDQIKQLEKLEKQIKIKFNDKDLLRQVFVHRSFLNENRQFDLGHNERLEFLGDAVLELVVTEYLYNNFPNPEGEMTNWRAALVRGERICEVGKVLKFEEYLLLSHGEEKNNGKAKNIILANTYEALVGAIYLDKGYKPAKKFIHDFLIIYLPEILEKQLHIDPKSRLQELTQEKLSETPSYQVHQEWGPDHAKQFKIGVYLQDRLIGIGEGSSKQVAQINAAQKALESWQESENNFFSTT